MADVPPPLVTAAEAGEDDWFDDWLLLCDWSFLTGMAGDDCAECRPIMPPTSGGGEGALSLRPVDGDAAREASLYLFFQNALLLS